MTRDRRIGLIGTVILWTGQETIHVDCTHGDHTVAAVEIPDRHVINEHILGLFTVAIFGPFLAHFQTHFWLIFGRETNKRKSKMMM